MAATHTADFATDESKVSPGLNLSQTVGNKLWLPMFVMAVMAFVIGFGVHLAKTSAVADATDPELIARLGHIATGINFIGFASVFAAISFAIARILGEFRTGGSDVQIATGGFAKTLKMPAEAKGFILLMAMAMMIILAGVIAHFIVAAQVGGNIALEDSELWAIRLEAVRRLGVAIYLLSILLGLATIVRVLKFQSLRIRELVG
ncbi:MAG TPA: hypothetical protein ENG98_01605 [Actinobacteria bacterium]|nr:hypothetical protein [Actinomycetota bacterium]